jgi:DNA-binding XRE family transcriptional regulator
MDERREAGRLLAVYRRDQGLTQEQLARAVGYSRATVAGVEGGHHSASEDFWRRCDAALAGEGALASRRALARPQRLAEAIGTGDADTGWRYAHTWVEAVDIVTTLWEQDVTRRAVIEGAVTAGTLAVPALRWSNRTAEAVSAVGAIPVDGAYVDGLGAVAEQLRSLDNRLGGGHVRAALLGILARQIAPRLRDGRFDTDLGRRFLSSAAELTQLLAWATHDMGEHTLAQQYLVHSLRLADAGDDATLGAEVLAGMSHQASFVGQGAVAVDLARASRRTATEVGQPALVAEAFVMEAHGHAVSGAEHACSTALSAAERWFSRAEDQPGPRWLGYFDEAYFSAKVAHCLRALGRLSAAERFAERSLLMDAGYVRGRMFNLAILASIRARLGNVDAAAALAIEAAGLGEELESRRGDVYLGELRRDFGSHRRQPLVADFLKRTTALAGT